MEKKGNPVLKTIGTLVITAVAVPIIIIVVFVGSLVVDGIIRSSRFDRMETGITKDGILRITDDGTGSMGSNWQIRIEGDAVELADSHVESSGFFTGTSLRQVYDLRAVSAGSAMVYVKAMHCGSYMYINLYSVSVDEKMQISYEKHYAECLFSHEKEAVLYRGDSRTDLTQDKFSDMTWYICGEWSESDKPSAETLDELTCIEFFGSDYYFDTDSGIIYVIDNNRSGDTCSAFIPDEWILPPIAEAFE